MVVEKVGLTENFVYTKTIGGRQQTITERLCDLVFSHTGLQKPLYKPIFNNVPVKMIMACSGHQTEKTVTKIH